MGGVLIYDSYSKMHGNNKLEQYYINNPPGKVNIDILFSKQESKEVSKDIFADKARERDFGTEQDKQFFKNLPKFQT